MRFSIFFATFATFSEIRATVVHGGPAFGISLSGGYGTISAYLQNGSYVDIAKVEGGDRYQAFMLGQREDTNPPADAKYCPFSQELCQYWPIKNQRFFNPLAPVLKALIAAAEARFETSACPTSVSAYGMYDFSYEIIKNHVKSALDEDNVHGLEYVVRTVWPLTDALGIEGKCSSPIIAPTNPLFREDPAQLVFSIEYTANSMIVTLSEEQCGLVEELGRLHSSKLGHNGMQSCRQEAKHPKSCDEEFHSALRGVIDKLTHSRGRDIGVVLLFGERADDKAMNTLLRQVLKDKFSNGRSVDFSRTRELSQDLTYVGSRALAFYESQRQADWENEDQYKVIKEL